MKNIKEYKNIIWILVIGLMIGIIIILNYKLNITEARAEIAEKPSKIELQAKELDDLSIKWREAEATRLESIKIKEEIEPKIQQLRLDMVGLQ